MALYFSTGLRNYVAQYGSYMTALRNGRMVIYQGTVPSSADASIGIAVALVTLSNASGTWGSETRSAGKIHFTYSTGDDSVTSILVADNAGGGIEVLGTTLEIGAAKTYTSLAQLVDAVADTINLRQAIGGIQAVSDGVDDISLYAPRGISPVTWGITTTTVGAGDLVAADTDFDSWVAGDAADNGIQWASATGGVLSKSGVWSGVAVTSGTANFFRIYGSFSDTGDLDSAYQYMRVQGSCGTSGTDYIMGTTSITIGKTHTADDFELTLPAS